MVNFSHERAKLFVLQQDARWKRPWQVFSNGERILQPNPINPDSPTNPRVRELEQEEALTFAEATDRTLIYEVRIIKTPELKKLISPRSSWQISFDGEKKVGFQAIMIKESQIQDLAWLVILAK